MFGLGSSLSLDETKRATSKTKRANLSGGKGKRISLLLKLLPA
jgi:hypothetical protein